MKKTLFIVFVIIGLISCNNEVKNQTVTIDNKYSMELPDYLTKTTKLNAEASLQYMDGIKELYIVVVEMSISDFSQILNSNDLTEDYKNNLEDYATFCVDYFRESVDVTSVSNPEETTINGLPAILYTMNANLNGYIAYYHFAYLKGKQNYYQVITWTLDSKESEHKDKMGAMIQSFKEL